MRIRLVALGIATLLTSTATHADDWITRAEPHFGYGYTFPLAAFSETPSDKPGFAHYDSNNAKFLVGAWDNRSQQTPAQFKSWMMENAGGYEDVTYEPRGRNWFVLSGYRGDQIYYEKIMFSCSRTIVTVLAISYPSSKRSDMDPVVERMEDGFKPSDRC